MSTLFLFSHTGEYLGKVSEEHASFEHPLIKKYIKPPVYITKETTENTDDRIHRTIYHKTITPEYPDFFPAITQNFQHQDLVSFIFSEEKEKIVDLLLKLSLAPEKNQEFFSMLATVPEENLQELYQGIIDDIEKSEQRIDRT